jgi:glyoxylase-like metal-dependent hydrolase (beta-lactamase superfamily II)
LSGPSPRVHRLSLPTPFPVGDVNAWLLDGDEPALIDAGVFTPRSLAALEQQLLPLGRRIEDLRRILLTHDHVDHAGASVHLARRSGAVLSLHPQGSLAVAWEPEEQERLRDFVLRCGVPRPRVEAAFEMFDLSTARLAAFDEPPPAVVRLAGGETVSCGGRTLEVLATPGHSPDHLCFLDAASGELFCGDTLLLRITPNPLLHLDPQQGYRRNRSLVQYLESLALLESRAPALAHPGHGPDIADVPRLIARGRAFIQRRKRLYRKRLDKGPLDPYALARAVFGELDLANEYLAVSETLAYLDLLELDGAIEIDWTAPAFTVVPR